MYQSRQLIVREMCGHLRDVPIQIGDLVVPLKFLVLEGSTYDVIFGLPTPIKLCALPDYYRMVV